MATIKIHYIKFLIYACLAWPNITYAKKIVIFTSTSEIGTAITNELTGEGHELFLTGRSKNKLNKFLEHNTTTIKTFQVDYTNLSTCQAFANNIPNGLDGVIVIPPRLENSPNAKSVPTNQDWHKIFDLLFINPITCLNMLYSKLSPEASIVLISGASSIDFLPDYANINIARQATALEAKNIATQWQDKKVRVNTVSPGKILTSFHAKKMNKQELEIAKKTLPKAEDLSHLLGFLLSDNSRYINGQNIVYDNGNHFLKTTSTK